MENGGIPVHFEDHIDGGGGIAVDIEEIEGGVEEFFSGVGAAGVWGDFGFMEVFWQSGVLAANKSPRFLKVILNSTDIPV